MQGNLFIPMPDPVLFPAVSSRAAIQSAAVVVLASSSGGNCSALVLETSEGPRMVLIDLGVSPRRCKRLLLEAGLADIPIVAAVVTHLDTDHLSPPWCQGTREADALLPREVPLYMHRRHVGRADRQGLLHRRTLPFTDMFEPVPGLHARAHIAPHDELGSASFRFVVATSGKPRHLGWATDVGRPTDDLAKHLAGVDVLAIESNYCPVMERESDRPEFLKRRVMGGTGHLSNQQSAELARRVAPSKHVVLLHLSRQCNTPERAAMEHAGAGYEMTIAQPDAPTARIPIG